MSRVVTISLKKQLEQVRQELVLKPTQEQDELQVQPMGNELVNVSNVNVAQKENDFEWHQNETTQVVQRNQAVLSNTHQTPQISTQQRAVNVQNGDNHEHVQLFDEVVLA